MPRNRKNWPYEYHCASCGTEYTRPEAQRHKFEETQKTPSREVETRHDRRGMGRNAARLGEPEIVYTVSKIPAVSTTKRYGYKCWDCGRLLRWIPLDGNNLEILSGQFVFHLTFGPGIVEKIEHPITFHSVPSSRDGHVELERDEPFITVSFHGGNRSFYSDGVNSLKVVSEEAYEMFEWDASRLRFFYRDLKEGKIPKDSPMTFGFKVGDDILHDEFGLGVIKEFAGAEDDTEVVANFDECGERSFRILWSLLKRAPFKIGDAVKNPRLGEGIIVDVLGVGEETEVVVDFGPRGSHHMLLRLAQLRKL